MENDSFEFTKEIFDFMASDVANLYIKSNLCDIDWERMRKDKVYARVMFYKKWAFERSGAAKRFRVIAMKCAASENWDTAIKEFLKNEMSLNKMNNPLFQKEGASYIERRFPPEISDLVVSLDDFENNIGDIFNENLSMPGIGHKIKSFFLRDMCFLSNKFCVKSLKVSHYLYLFPMDTWVIKFLKFLRDVSLLPKPEGDIEICELNLGKEPRLLAISAIGFCKEKNICPLHLNMGIWKYCSDFVQSEERLKMLLKSKDISLVRKEFYLLQNHF